MRALPAIVAMLAVVVSPAFAQRPAVDPKPPVLEKIADQLDDVGVDVLLDHDSEAGQSGPSFGDAPRLAPLIGFKSWSDRGIDLDGHSKWMDAFAKGARGAVAAAPADGEDTRPSLKKFKKIWKNADREKRIVVTFDEDDLETAEKIADVLEKNDYAVYLAVASPDREDLKPELLGYLFVEAGQVLAIDTASARLNGIIQFEADVLAELRRQTAFVESNDDGLPPIKRGSMDVVEALGVLPMKVLPGGIVFGMPPKLEVELVGASLAIDGSDYGIAVGDQRFVMEQVSVETREAIEGFVAIENSHSVVDIAGGEVTLADPLRDTRVGKRMANADRRPFKRLDVNGAQKSLIVDNGIRLRRDGDRVVADVELGSPDHLRTALKIFWLICLWYERIAPCGSSCSSRRSSPGSCSTWCWCARTVRSSASTARAWSRRRRAAWPSGRSPRAAPSGVRLRRRRRRRRSRCRPRCAASCSVSTCASSRRRCSKTR
jgi:hypothetical protein